VRSNISEKPGQPGQLVEFLPASGAAVEMIGESL
jgi:hypothetical protein